MEKLAHAVGAVSRAGHGSMMVEGELMNLAKPMSPWSGQEVTSTDGQSHRLPLPFPDPYGKDPTRPSHSDLITRTDCPYTAEPNNLELYKAGLITPNRLFYIRDHLPAPDLTADDYTLTIEGPGVSRTTLNRSLAQLHGGAGDGSAKQRINGSRDGGSSSNASSGCGGSSSIRIEDVGEVLIGQSSSSKSGSATLTLADLRESFQQHSILATMQCAGNRRNDMRRLKEVKGGPWEAGAIGTALWTGPCLRDVLAAAGVDVGGLVDAEQQRQQVQQELWAQAAARLLNQQQQQQEEGSTAAPGDRAPTCAQAETAVTAAAPAGPAEESFADLLAEQQGSVMSVRHVWFEGYDNAGPDTHFLVSIPILDALSPNADVLLALQMNGEDLPPYHGFPVRVVAPGHVGVRSVKWLKRIVLSQHEAPSHWQQTDYKMLPPYMNSQAKADWGAVPAMQILPVQSAICVPATGQVVEVSARDGCIEVGGYAWSGGGVGVIRVEVTADGGKSWTSAELLGMEQLLQQGAEAATKLRSDAQGENAKPLIKGLPAASTAHAVGVPDSVSRRQGFSGRAWGWTLWKARVPVSLGLSKAKAAVMGQTYVSKAGCGGKEEGNNESSNEAEGAAQLSEQQQQLLQDEVDRKQDRQQQVQQGEGGSSGGMSSGGTSAASGGRAGGDDATTEGAGDEAEAVGGDAGVAHGSQLVRLSVKAVDARYSSQPADVGSIWNIRGAGNNAWHSVEVYV